MYNMIRKYTFSPIWSYQYELNIAIRKILEANRSLFYFKRISRSFSFTQHRPCNRRQERVNTLAKSSEKRASIFLFAILRRLLIFDRIRLKTSLNFCRRSRFVTLLPPSGSLSNLRDRKLTAERVALEVQKARVRDFVCGSL